MNDRRNMSNVHKTNEENFEADVIKAEGKVLVDFYADWCGPCKTLGPMLDEVSKEVSGKIFKIDVDSNDKLVNEYGIRGVPTTILFENGVASKTIVGIPQGGKNDFLELFK